MLSIFEPVNVGIPIRRDGGNWSKPINYGVKHCDIENNICSIAHYDFFFQATHREFVDNPYYKGILILDDESWHANQFFSWNINSWSFKNHIFVYYRFGANNAAHDDYPRGRDYNQKAIGWMNENILKNNSKIMQCYYSSNKSALDDCGKYNCIYKHHQYQGWGYPKAKENTDYSVTINFQNVSQYYIYNLCLFD